MNVPNGSTAPEGLRGWWASPARSGMRRMISPWEYRNLRFWAGVRVGGGLALVGLGVVTFSFGKNDSQTYGWTVAILAAAAANLAFGYWELTIAHRPFPQRVRDLEQSRAYLVDDSAARLRRIERDLHDGAQAQMVAVTMKLGLAVKKLGGMTGGAGQADVERVLELITAAELLANVSKHSGARHATLEAVHVPGLLRVRVSDDGCGGARVDARGGLAGLAERIKSVDGALHLSSPPGGPSVVTVELPSHA